MKHYTSVYRVALVREGSIQVATKTISSPQEAADAVRAHLADADRETFVVVALTATSRIIGIHTVSVGILDRTLVHPREVFKAAILMNAASIIVAHNHPSGNPTPSAEDRAVTERLIAAGRLLGIEVSDHLILGADTFISLKEQGGF